MLTQTNTTVVGRLRIRSKSPDPQAEERRIAQMLRSATLHPTGLPESAMLVVRRLVDPLPSRLRASPFDLLPDPAWQRAIADELKRMASLAARPAFGMVPAETNAVLFYDRAEVLASLAMDWTNGALPTHWWWRELLRGRDGITALIREWIEAPQYIPAALQVLAQRTRAVQFVQRLPEQAAAEMLDAVLTTHGIPRIQVEAVQQKAGIDEALPDVKTHRKAKAKPSYTELQAPWMPWVQEASTPGLLPVQKIFLIQSLMLRRAPSVVRTLGFQRALALWQARAESIAEPDHHEEEFTAVQDVVVSAQELAVDTVPASQTQNKKLAELVGASGLQARENKQAEQMESPSAQASEIPRETKGQQKKKRPVEWVSELVSERAESATATFAEKSQVQSAGVEEPAIAEEPAVSPKARIEEVFASEEVITLETEFGGVFFLLSLALYLYIYGDFTRPAEQGLELNIWDFLALMAFEFTGGEIATDPLWEGLAALAGRTALQRPGAEFNPPDEWRVPAAWLEAFPESYDPEPILTNGRMITMHPAGFPWLDIPASTDEKVEQPERLQRWVGWMAAYFRARLVRALGRQDAVEILCQKHARIAHTLTHIDVTFSLERHPIEVRMSGLDRDLGWIPAAGRYVAFHFE